MNLESAFIGSLNTTSTKLKQTVHLNRRTVSNLDHEIHRFQRQKDKNTHLISREREKFLLKQSRLLPTINKAREDELLLRVKVNHRSQQRPKSTSSLHLPTPINISPPSNRKIQQQTSYAPSPPLSRKIQQHHYTASPPLYRKVQPIYSTSSPPLCRRVAVPIGGQKVRASTLIEQSAIPLRNSEDTANVHKRITRTRSRSLSDLPPPQQRPGDAHQVRRTKRQSNPVALKRWTKIRRNLRYLINVELMGNFSLACERLQDCRYIRHTKRQQKDFIVKRHGKSKCYCNTCTMNKTRFIH